MNVLKNFFYGYMEIINYFVFLFGCMCSPFDSYVLPLKYFGRISTPINHVQLEKLQARFHPLRVTNNKT